MLGSAETSDSLLTELRQLLVDGFGDFPEEDWGHTTGGWRVVAFDGDEPVSHAAVVPRTIQVARRAFDAGYVEGVATRPGRQRAGLGSLVMSEATRLVQDRHDLGVLSTGLHDFYERFGWQRWQGAAFVRDGDRLVRTEDEDDAIMVLRCGPSRDIDLTGPISCDRRSGDDW